MLSLCLDFPTQKLVEEGINIDDGKLAFNTETADFIDFSVIKNTENKVEEEQNVSIKLNTLQEGKSIVTPKNINQPLEAFPAFQIASFIGLVFFHL